MVYQLLIWITRWIGFFVERKLVHQTDYFITVNESLARYFEKQYGMKKVYSVKNCPLKLPAPPKEKIPNIRALYGLPDNTILLLYQGMINPGRALELFIPSLKHAPNHIHFFMIGDGYLKVDLEALIKKEGLSHKVHFLGYIPHMELACYTHAFDYVVNMGGGNLSKNLGLSNKLFEYMHAGIPVLCSRNPENEAIFHEFEMGVLVENEESSILRGLELLVKSDRYSYYSDNCLRAADKYNWEKESEIIRKVLI